MKIMWKNLIQFRVTAMLLSWLNLGHSTGRFIIKYIYTWWKFLTREHYAIVYIIQIVQFYVCRLYYTRWIFMQNACGNKENLFFSLSAVENTNKRKSMPHLELISCRITHTGVRRNFSHNVGKHTRHFNTNKRIRKSNKNGRYF